MAQAIREVESLGKEEVAQASEGSQCQVGTVLSDTKVPFSPADSLGGTNKVPQSDVSATPSRSVPEPPGNKLGSAVGTNLGEEQHTCRH